MSKREGESQRVREEENDRERQRDEKERKRLLNPLYNSLKERRHLLYP